MKTEGPVFRRHFHIKNLLFPPDYFMQAENNRFYVLLTKVLQKPAHSFPLLMNTVLCQHENDG